MNYFTNHKFMVVAIISAYVIYSMRNKILSCYQWLTCKQINKSFISLNNNIDTLHLSGKAQVSINVDPHRDYCSIEITGHDNITALTTSHTTDKSLFISQKGNYTFQNNEEPTYCIYLNQLNSINIQDTICVRQITGYNLNDHPEEKPPCTKEDAKNEWRNYLNALPSLYINIAGNGNFLTDDELLYTTQSHIYRTIYLTASNKSTSMISYSKQLYATLHDKSQIAVSYCRDTLTLDTHDNTVVDAQGGFAINGNMCGNSILNIMRYERDYKKIKVNFLDKAKKGNCFTWG